MRFCSGITKSGTRCTHSVHGSSQYCHLHDPARSEDRRRIASRAGKSKPSRVLLELRDRLVQLGEDVLDDAVDSKKAAVAGQLYNIAIRATEVQRKLYESEELERRIAELERLDNAERDSSSGARVGRWR